MKLRFDASQVGGCVAGSNGIQPTPPYTNVEMKLRQQKISNS